MKLVYAEGKKPDTKDNILYYLYKILELQQVIFINRKEISSCSDLELGESDCKGASFGVIEIFDILIRRVLYVKNSFNSPLKCAFNYM